MNTKHLLVRVGVGIVLVAVAMGELKTLQADENLTVFNRVLTEQRDVTRGKDVEVPVKNGLAIILTGGSRLEVGKEIEMKISFTNKSKQDFQIVVPDKHKCYFYRDLEFAPALKDPGGAHTLKPNFHPGSVQTVQAGKTLHFAFQLRRTPDGIYVPSHIEDEGGCAVAPLPLPKGLAEIQVLYRHADPGEDWANLKYTGTRWTGKEMRSNAVRIKLPPGR